MALRFSPNFKRNIGYNIFKRLYITPTKTFNAGSIVMTTSTSMRKLEGFNRGKEDKNRNRDCQSLK